MGTARHGHNGLRAENSMVEGRATEVLLTLLQQTYRPADGGGREAALLLPQKVCGALPYIRGMAVSRPKPHGQST
ncbi:hypothetical protein [uncultured Ruminococcus sp.]|uniref:hypothetical protein n=1 Tax=uncultured Ruminococcus sp. TaxID=165186 RepID=UPI0025DE0BF7|nr:hypothetical protein [uncultured Ruminococcus sp.]